MSVSTVNQSAGYAWSTNHEFGRTWYNNWVAGSGDAGGVTYTANAQIYKGGTNNYDIYRSSAVFDTSGIPSTATIHSAYLNLYRKREWSQIQYSKYTYVCPMSATGSSTGYYNKDYFGSYIAGWDANGQSDNVNQWVQMDVASGIVKAGSTIFGFRHWCDYNNVEPGGNNGTDQTYSDDYRGANATYLSITWTTPPAVTTGSASLVQPISATLAGEITDVGGGTVSSCGVCWNTTGTPTVASSKTISDDNTGAFTVSATGLLPGTKYYYKAYVVTENSTQYGSEQNFTTPGGAILFNLL
jgi:hypothetical protein